MLAIIIAVGVVICLVLFASVLLALLQSLLKSLRGSSWDTPWRRAGREGEHITKEIIQNCLDKRDLLLNNVVLVYEGKRAELDNVVINSRGVFIIEAKNYVGELYGTEEDREWKKVKVSNGGEFYQKTVMNPIKQVDRQIYILASYLKQHGIKVWVEGYVYFVQRNAPFKSERFLTSPEEIRGALHFGHNNNLNVSVIQRIHEILK